MATRKTATKAETKKEEKKVLIGTVIGGTLNIREEPDVTSRKLGQLFTGTEIEIIETLEGWYRMKLGFVMAEFVRVDTECQEEE